MREKFFNDLQGFAQKAIKVVKKNLDLADLGFDHICYQTLSSSDYKETLKALKKEISIIKEIPHSGRRIAVARLKNQINVDGVIIDKIEISEPKPKRTVKKAHFDHFALFVKGDFKSFINSLKHRKIKIFEEKQIGDDKIAKFKDNGIEIEIRNNKLAENGHTKQKKVKKASKENKYKDGVNNLLKELEDEKESKLRALADYQNLLKRLDEDRKNMKMLANADILNALLDILEDLDRVINNLKIDESEQVGIRLVRDKIRKLIDSNGLVEIEIHEGDMLDANKCEAVGVVAVKEKRENNMIKQVVQKGYKMEESDNIVRPVKVIVGKK